jgi:hypothetical protein
MAMSFCREREGGACASRVKFYRISSSPEPPARIVPDTIDDALRRLANVPWRRRSPGVVSPSAA